MKLDLAKYIFQNTRIAVFKQDGEAGQNSPLFKEEQTLWNNLAEGNFQVDIPLEPHEYYTIRIRDANLNLVLELNDLTEDDLVSPIKNIDPR